MLTAVHPKLPMRNKEATSDFYVNKLNFSVFGATDYPDYLMLERDDVQIHFFLHPDLDPLTNYGQIYLRTEAIDQFYDEVSAHEINCTKPIDKPWGMREFAIWDPDHNLLTIGQEIKRV